MEDKEKVEPIEPTENPRPRTQFSDLREAYLKERGMQDGRPKKPFKPKQELRKTTTHTPPEKDGYTHELRMKKTSKPMPQQELRKTTTHTPKKLAPTAEEKAEEYKRLKD
jgi:hypothetical protein